MRHTWRDQSRSLTSFRRDGSLWCQAIASLPEVIRSFTVTGPVTQYSATSSTVSSSIRVMSSHRRIPFNTVIVRCRNETRAGSRSPGHGLSRIATH